MLTRILIRMSLVPLIIECKFFIMRKASTKPSLIQHESEKYLFQKGIDMRTKKKINVNFNKKSDDYEVNEEYYTEYYEDEGNSIATSTKRPKKRYSNFRSGVMKGEILTEEQIIEKLRKRQKIPLFQLHGLEAIKKCSPGYYCSNKFLDKVCKEQYKEWDNQFPCKVEMKSRGSRGAPLMMAGSCKLEYMGCEKEKKPEPVVTNETKAEKSIEASKLEPNTTNVEEPVVTFGNKVTKSMEEKITLKKDIEESKDTKSHFEERMFIK